MSLKLYAQVPIIDAVAKKSPIYERIDSLIQSLTNHTQSRNVKANVRQLMKWTTNYVTFNQ